MTKLLIKMFLGDKSPAASPSVRRAYGKLAGAVGIFMNFLLFSVKLLAGIISGSVSILADAFNNLSDIGSSAVSLLGFKLAGKPADPEHPYGHGRMEYMAGFIVAVLIILVGFELLRSSVGKIIAGGGSSVSPWMFAVLFVSALLKLWLFFFNRSLSKKIGAGLLMAAARDSMGDVLATSAVLACAGAEYFWSIHIDGYIGALVALFIVYSGFDTARDTVDQLLGKAPGDEIVGKLRALVLKYEEFSGLHDLLIHSYGPGRYYASLDVEVNAGAGLRAVHDAIDRCEREALDTLDIHLVLHADPSETGDARTDGLLRKVTDGLKEIDPALSLHDFRVKEIDGETALIFDVVLPPGYPPREDRLLGDIEAAVREIQPSCRCTIHFDRNYTNI